MEKYLHGINETVSYTYLSRMALDTVNGLAAYVTDTLYNAAGQVELRKLGGTAASPTLKVDTSYFPWDMVNGLGRVKRIISGTPADSDSLQDLRYYSGTDTPQYDANGNLLNIYDYKAGSPQTQIFTYDSLDRLLSAAASGGTGGIYSESYTYNGTTGNLASKGGVTTAYVGNYFEWTGSTSTMVKYYYAGTTRVAMRVGSNNPKWLLSDHLGSQSIVASYDGSTEEGELRYRAWGESRYTSGTTPTKRQYTGQLSEMTTIGLYFYGARFYDPAISRFVQADSIIPGAGDAQAWDRYAAMGNNPVRFNDPTGHCPDDKNGKASENGCWKYWKQLSEKYPNVSINHFAFSKAQLQVIGQALKIARTAFEGQANFEKAVGPFGITTANSLLDKRGVVGMAPPGLSYIYLVNDYFSNVHYQINIILHEIGHIFDFHGSGPGLDPMHYKSQAFVDKYAPGCDVGYFGCVSDTSDYAPYNLGGASSGYGGFNYGKTTDYGANSSIDDFADSFAAYAWLSVDMTPYNLVNRGRIRLMGQIIQQAIR